MTDARFIAALLAFAGTLRVMSSFITYRPGNDWLELFYIVIDLCFLVGLCGFFALHGAKLRASGRVAMVIMLCGFGLIAGPEAPLFGVSIYQIGAPLVAFGAALFGVALLRHRVGTRMAPALLIASLLIGCASMLSASGWLFTLAGVSFGLGFALLGLSLWLADAPPVRRRLL